MTPLTLTQLREVREELERKKRYIKAEHDAYRYPLKDEEYTRHLLPYNRELLEIYVDELDRLRERHHRHHGFTRGDTSRAPTGGAGKRKRAKKRKTRKRRKILN